MKLIKTLLIIGILFATVGCQTEEAEKTSVGEVVTLTVDGEAKGYCTLTVSEEEDGYFLMVDRLFSTGIECETKDDCYNFLLEDDDFRSLVPELHPYIGCEERVIEPNKMRA